MGFFQTVIDFFQRLWDFIVNMLYMLVSALTMLISGLSGMQLVLTWVPAVVGGCALVAISILVVRFLLLK